MKKRSLWIVLVAVALHASDKKTPPADPRAPLAVDEIHYYLTDPGRAILFFETHFLVHEIPQPGTQPLKYVTMLGMDPGEAELQISPPGPFDGIVDADPKMWSKEMIVPAMNMPARYGIYWVGIRTTSLKRELARMESRGVTVQDRRVVLPIDPKAKAASIYGPDFNVFTLVERSKRHGESSEFGVDHVQLLVKSVADNVRFFQEVFSAQVTSQSPNEAVLSVAGFTIGLAEPEGLDLVRADVQERSPAQFRFEADHIGFLFADIHPAVDAAKAKGRKFKVEPTRLEYYGKPTRYTYAVIESPDGMPFELVMEDGRTGSGARK